MGSERTVRVVLAADTGKFQSGMAKAGASVDQLQGRIAKTASSGTWKAFGTGALIAGAGLAAAFGGMVKAAAGFDKQLSAVRTALQPTAGEMDQLRQAALDAGIEFGQFDATEAAVGITELGKAGVATKDILNGGLTGALALAASGQMEVGDAAELAASAMNQFKLEGKDIPKIADALSAGANKAQGSVADLGAGLQQSGIVAGQFGISMEETVGTLAAFASAGMVGSDAGTSLKTMLLALATPSKQQAKAMEDLGLQAYDAQGNFVGLDGLAGQLQSTMGGLDQETRNAALGVIFGNDAIRAANILFTEGAAGIQGWTDEVSKSGSAMETATSLTDNLAGDMDELSGTIQTVFIEAGSGANDAIRGIVQQVTGLIDTIGSIPGPVLEAGAGIVGALGVGSLAVGGIMKATTAVVDMRATFRKLSVDSPKLAGGLKKVGLAAAGIAIAGAGLTAWGAGVRDSFDKARTSADDLKVIIERTAKSGESLNLDALFKFEEGAIAKDSIDGIGESLKRVFQADGVQGFGDFMNGLTGMPTITDEIKKSFAELDASLAGMDAKAAADTFAQVQAQAEAVGVSVDDLRTLFPDYTSKLQENASAAGQAKTGTESLKGALDPTTTAVADQAEAMEALKEATKKAADDALGLSGAQMGLEAAIDDATASVKENGRTLDIGSEKGRANRAALDDIASSAQGVIEAMDAQGRTTEQVNAKTASARDQFVKVAAQMGMTKTQADQLADSYGLIPRRVSTTIAVPGAKLSKDDADRVNAAIRNIPPDKRASIVTIANTQGAEAAMRAIEAVKNKTVYVDVYQRTHGVPVASGSTKGGITKADGGVVEFYAGGGLRESHVAQIAPAGAWRVWAEEETGGEAYIPLALSKRGRSTAILDDVAQRFGYSLTRYADGGFASYSAASSPAASSVTISASAMRSAMDGMRLTLVADGRPITAIVRAELSGVANTVRGR